MGASGAKPGYQILEVLQDSPSDQKGLMPHLDFIVSINNSPVVSSQIPFQELIQDYENTEVILGVFSLETMETRQIALTPSEWNGEGLLGLNLRYEDSQDINSKIMKITHLLPNSPAFFGGLLEGEFIIGVKDSRLSDIETINSLLKTNKQITLFIYNKLYRTVRTAKLESDTAEIGMQVATGPPHQIFESS